jgi:hypothetical protein
MKAKTMMLTLASAAAAAAVGFAIWRSFEARAATAALADARARREVLAGRIAAAETQAREARGRAAEAERDVGELLRAVAAVRGASRARVATVVRESTPVTELPPGAAGASGADDQVRLAQERKYQQELAKKRAEEAKARAAFDVALSTQDKAAKYRALIEAAERALAAAEFQFGIRLYNQAMMTKPADQAVTDQVRALQAALQAQNKPVEVVVQSDGVTWVTVRHARAPAQFATATIKLLPGNYEVVGRRPGYREVVVLIAVRCDLPPPAVRIGCTEPATP